MTTLSITSQISKCHLKKIKIPSQKTKSHLKKLNLISKTKWNLAGDPSLQTASGCLDNSRRCRLTWSPEKHLNQRNIWEDELIIFLWIPKPFVWLENGRKKIFRCKFSSVESSQDNSTFWQDMRQTWQLCWEKFSTRMSRVWSSRPRRPAHQCFSLTQALTSLLTSRKTPSSYVLWIQLCSPPQGGLAWSEEWSIPFGMKFWQTILGLGLLIALL